jgi:hypothetical protein
MATVLNCTHKPIMQDGLCVDRKTILPLRSCPVANHSGLLCTEQMCTNHPQICIYLPSTHQVGCSLTLTPPLTFLTYLSKIYLSTSIGSLPSVVCEEVGGFT